MPSGLLRYMPTVWKGFSGGTPTFPFASDIQLNFNALESDGYTLYEDISDGVDNAEVQGGEVAEFDGVNDTYINYGNPSVFYVPSGQDFWCAIRYNTKALNSTTQSYFGHVDNSSDSRFGVYITNTNIIRTLIDFDGGSQKIADTVASPSTNTWGHVFVYADRNGNLTMYTDYETVTVDISVDVVRNLTLSGSFLVGGRNESGSYVAPMNGYLSELYWGRSTLDSAQITKAASGDFSDLGGLAEFNPYLNGNTIDRIAGLSGNINGGVTFVQKDTGITDGIIDAQKNGYFQYSTGEQVVNPQFALPVFETKASGDIVREWARCDGTQANSEVETPFYVVGRQQIDIEIEIFTPAVLDREILFLAGGYSTPIKGIALRMEGNGTLFFLISDGTNIQATGTPVVLSASTLHKISISWDGFAGSLITYNIDGTDRTITANYDWVGNSAERLKLASYSSVIEFSGAYSYLKYNNVCEYYFNGHTRNSVTGANDLITFNPIFETHTQDTEAYLAALNVGCLEIFKDIQIINPQFAAPTSIPAANIHNLIKSYININPTASADPKYDVWDRRNQTSLSTDSIYYDSSNPWSYYVGKDYNELDISVLDSYMNQTDKEKAYAKVTTDYCDYDQIAQVFSYATQKTNSVALNIHKYIGNECQLVTNDGQQEYNNGLPVWVDL